MKSDKTNNLLDYYLRPCKKARLLGVIVDATRPFKTETAPDFTTKIKIIDETLNISTEKINNNKKYIHVFIYSKSLKEAPDITRIGDIIYLKYYDLEYFSTNSEIKAKKRGSFSKYYIFDGNPANSREFQVKMSDDSEVYEAKPTLQIRIQELRNWTRVFFANNSLLKMNWFGSLKIDASVTGQTRDFDMILKLKSIKNTNNPNLVVFELVDGKNQAFFLQFSKEHAFQTGDIMKIRSIIRMGNHGDLFPNTYSSLLKLPSFCYDCVNFEGKIVYEVSNLAPTEAIIEELPEIPRKIDEKYVETSDFLATVIKNQYISDEKTKEIAKIKEILQLTRDFKGGKVQKDAVLNRIFRIRCYIFDIFPEELGEAVKNLCTKCKKMSDFNVKEQKHCCNSLNEPVWNMRLAVKDASIDEEASFLEVYICDFDGNNAEIFNEITTKSLKPLNFEEISRKFAFLTAKILDNSSLDYQSELILTPLISQNDVIYRVIDTKFTGK